MGDDEDFKKFLSEGDSGDVPFFLTFSLREKAKTLAELYELSLKFYTKLDKPESVSTKIDEKPKKDTLDYIEQLRKHSLLILNQFDILIIDEIEDEDEDEGDISNPLDT